jgi:hypothetical protein
VSFPGEEDKTAAHGPGFQDEKPEKEEQPAMESRRRPQVLFPTTVDICLKSWREFKGIMHLALVSNGRWEKEKPTGLGDLFNSHNNTERYIGEFLLHR